MHGGEAGGWLGHDSGTDPSTDSGMAMEAGPPPVVGNCENLPKSGTWETITPPGVATADALALDPFNVGTIWLGADPNGGTMKGLGGVWKSSNCGATWTHVNTGMNGDMVDQAHIWSMALDYVHPGVIYVVGAYGPWGLWKSTNGGVDWVQLLTPGGVVANTAPAGPSNPSLAAIGSVSMDPTNPDHLLLGTHATCQAPYGPLCEIESTDGGNTWKIINVPIPGINGWLEQSGPYALDAMTSLYATIFNGLWLTTDDGAHWKNVTPAEVNGATGGEYTHRRLTKSPLGKYYLPGYGMKNGLLTSSDGKAWSYISNSPNGSYELGFAIGAGHLYLGDFNGKTYQSAAEASPSTWQMMPTPAIPSQAQGPQSMEYIARYHVLYSSNFTGGLWRIVTR
jgi:hypothetical protein